MISDALATHVESLDLGVERYGGRTHYVNYDGAVTRFFCGRAGVRVARRFASRRASCPDCTNEAKRLAFKGV